MSRGFVISVLVAALAGWGFSGCRKVEEKLAEKAAERTTGGKVDIDSKTGNVKMKQKGADGKETNVEFGEGTAIPADFPKSVPVYPGAKVIAAVAISQGAGGHMLTLTTKDSTTDVLAYYKKNLSSFKQDGELNNADTTILTMSTPELSVSVTATKSDTDNETMIQLTTTKQKGS
jgi:hypothetical protein